MNKYYYAILNDNNVCIDITAKVNKLPSNTAKHVPLQEYNEMYFHRKWDSETQWSHETYEPELDTVIQDELKSLREESESLRQENVQLNGQVVGLNGAISQLEGTIMELTVMIASFQGGN